MIINKDRFIFEDIKPSRDAIGIVTYSNQDKCYWYSQVIGRELRILDSGETIQDTWDINYNILPKETKIKTKGFRIDILKNKPADIYDRDFVYVSNNLTEKDIYDIMNIESVIFSVSGLLAPSSLNRNTLS
jgi:hypothetical protein